MRKAVMAVLLFAAVPLFAQDQKFRVSVFVNGAGYSQSDSSGSNWHGDLGGALEYRWNQKWALELSLGRDEHRSGEQTVENYPVDLMANYQFRNDTRWKPYLGAGVRYVTGVRTPFGEFGNTVAAQVGGGVHFMITPVLSLRLDAKQAIPGSDVNLEFRPSIGLGWRF